ncbi:MAG: DUF1223 domain-containing protein [Zoogloeaceae bacterium]|nr:DUF1223 domain-containing protein [Zoogloeaceae bacterium]
MKLGFLPLIPWACLLMASPAGATSCAAQGVGPVAVVELYTSEGCSSCPPADRWLSRLAPGEPGPVRVIPLALHVTYWDDLGWRDPFADPRFDARQRSVAHRQSSRVIYTPQVLVNGQDFRDWRSGGLDARLSSLAARPAGGRLEIDAKATPEGTSLTVAGDGPPGAQLILIRTEDGLTSSVKAGENAGRSLSHDHVARDWRVLGAVGPTGHFRFQATTPAFKPGTNYVALLEDSASGTLLQAVRLGACPSRA